MEVVTLPGLAGSIGPLGDLVMCQTPGFVGPSTASSVEFRQSACGEPAAARVEVGSNTVGWDGNRMPAGCPVCFVHRMFQG